ncbi:MAG: hypothetical protein NTZ14_08950 [Hyphomicrobiales bacterium]|nr:hypothetical protein [Hyphomicrobiales bacterium]
MFNLLVVSSLIAAICIMVLSGLLVGPATIVMEFASVVFATSVAISTLAIAAIDG